MKRNLLSMFAVAAGLLMATSCSTKQEEEVTTGGEAVVTFTAQLPSGLGSRAPQKTTDDGATTTATFGDGNTATRLQYAVYKVGANNEWTLIEELSKDTKTLSDRKATVSLQLVNGNTYAVAFWADVAENSIYSFNKTKDNVTITADYTTKTPTSSNESYDAFYAVKTFKVNGSSQMPVELKRPFAQLNIGTADLKKSEEAGYDVKQAAVTVKTYSTFNFKNEEVEGDAAEVTFALANLPTTEKFPVDGYTYLAMNYLLMSADKKADNTVTISYDDESGVQKREFTNVPLQRNYRTNIYGNLLTSTTQFNVVINSEFDGALCGKAFSVAYGKTVAFSKGNLQYTQSTDTWSFADNQYDFIGAANFSGSTLADKIDLFGWSCTGHEWGNSISATFAGTDFVDWGKNTIGTYESNTYRTLTVYEWDYLLYSRDEADKKYGVACITIDNTKSVNGLILLPDIWTPVEGVNFKSGLSTNTSTDAADYAKQNSFTLEQWKKLEAAGAVFLPAAGRRDGTNHNETVYGFYWSSDLTSSIFGTMSWAFALQVTPNYSRDITSGEIENSMASHLLQTNFGGSVRLVQDL